MKKIIAVAAGMLVLCSAAFTQVLSSSGVKNTLSTSFGLPYDRVNNSDREDVHLYGLLETLQVRFDVDKFTVEGMLNWGALTYWKADGSFGNFTFANTGITPFYYTNHSDQGGWWTSPKIEGYYVNFLYHPVKNFDFGMGTRLNWNIGPAPSSLDNYWGYKAHVVQGGLKDAAPGHADVAGYIYYANCYTSLYEANTKAALGARYRYEDLLEVGASIPSGITTDKPLFNAAFMIHPVDFLRLSVAYEGVMRPNGNFYSGVTLDFKNIVIDGYLAIDFRKSDFYFAGSPENWGNQWGTGGAVTFYFPKAGITLRPETAFSFYADSNYSMAWYSGARLDIAFSEKFNFGAWSSLAFGAYDKRWYDKDYEGTDLYHPDYVGGQIFDVRPELTWTLNKYNSLTVYLDFQNRLKFTDENWNTWSSGLYWTYKK